MEPLGESLPNQEIFRRLARAMRFRRSRSSRERTREMLSDCSRRARLREDFASLKTKGTIFVPREPAVQFADGVFRRRAGASRSRAPPPRPTGSARCRSAGATRVRRRESAPAVAGTRWLLNTSFGNVEQDPRAPWGRRALRSTRADAAERRLATGISHSCTTDCGRLKLEVTICGRNAARRRARAQRPMARDRSRARQCQRIESGAKSDMGESTRCTAWSHAVAPRAAR